MSGAEVVRLERAERPIGRHDPVGVLDIGLDAV